MAQHCLAFKAGHRRCIGLEVNLPAGHQAEHDTIGEEAGPAEHAAHTDSAERLEQVVDKFDIHNPFVSNSFRLSFHPLAFARHHTSSLKTGGPMSALGHKRTYRHIRPS